MKPQLVTIGKAANIMGISIDTLRRWDKSGKFPSIRKIDGNRYYDLKDIDDYLITQQISAEDLFSIANYWASKKEPTEPDKLFYCSNSAVFLANLTKLQNKLAEIPELEGVFPLIIAMAGEIGDNSFAHNIGNWPDIPGIFFGYDIAKRELVLADRGRGILKTLQRVRPSLQNSADALKVAFTEIISGRAPEERGNGLKYVRKIAVNNDITLYFKTGDAEVEIKKDNEKLEIKKAVNLIHGCITLIKF